MTNDFHPRRKEIDLSATVPDIFAATGHSYELPSESTSITLVGAGKLTFPGNWERRSRQDADCETYRNKASISAVLSIGRWHLEERAKMLINKLSSGEPRALLDFELSALKAVLSMLRKNINYEFSAGCTELLCHKMVLVLQSEISEPKMKEALIIFPTGSEFGQISLQAIKPEFQSSLNYLRHALKSIEWS